MELDAKAESLAVFTAYSLIVIGAIGVSLNTFLLAFLLHSLLKKKIIAQKIVYINLAISNLAFSLVACVIRGPGLFIQKLFKNRGFCVVTTYMVSYFSKVDLLVIVPITLSILLVTVRGFQRCTIGLMIKLCSISWLIPLIFLASFTIKGHVTPDSFYIRYSNKSGRCDFTGTAHPSYLTSQSVLFFYLPTILCGLMYLIVGYFHHKYQIAGVGKLAKRGCFVTGFYCACWLPFMIVSSYYRGDVSRQVFVFTYLFYYFSVIVNPLTYTLTSQFFSKMVSSFLSEYSSTRPIVETDKKEGGGEGVRVGHDDMDSVEDVESGEDMTSRAGPSQCI